MKSMTGMGRARGLVCGVPVRLEIKAVNHRFCEINFRSPGRYSVLEIPIQQLIKGVIARGRIDVFLFEDKAPSLSAQEVSAFKEYHSYLSHIKNSLGLKEEVSLQHLLSGIGGWLFKEIDESKAWADLKPVVESALADLNKMRQTEGATIKLDMKNRVLAIQEIKAKVDDVRGGVKDELASRLETKLADKIKDLGAVDPQRLHTEILFYLDRMDISEECQRIDSHVAQLVDFLGREAAVGRQVDFLLQELNREFNTIASKSQNATVSHLVVDAKAELEKIREQVQNVE